MLGDRFGSDLLILNGTDSYLQLALENHAGGCITASANLISPDLRQVWDAFQRGEDVTQHQERIAEIRLVLEKYPPFAPTLKLLLSKLHGFPHWSVRPPLMQISPQIVEKITEEFIAVSG